MSEIPQNIDRINYLKANVERYLPGIIKVLGDNTMDWDYINDLFEQVHEERVNRFNAGTSEALTVEAHIYDIIVEVKKENRRAINLLDYFDKLMHELALNLEADERKLIVNNIRNILISFNSNYLNFIGELAVLNSLVRSKLYKLISVEEPLANKKSLDFKLLRTSDNKIQLVEIMNIHLDDSKVVSDNDLLEKFMSHRFNEKIADKRRDLEANIDFFLVPILWGSADSLRIYSQHFENNEMYVNNVIEPVSYLTFGDENDPTFLMHRFGRVSNLFNTTSTES